MNEELINVAIAESLGHEIFRADGKSGHAWNNGCKVFSGGGVYIVTGRRMTKITEETSVRNLPDYCGSLDAMARVVDKLEPIIERAKYPEILAQVVAKKEGFRTNGLPLPDWHWVNATSYQRAQAYLMVKGLWKDSMLK